MDDDGEPIYKGLKKTDIKRLKKEHEKLVRKEEKEKARLQAAERKRMRGESGVVRRGVRQGGREACAV